MLEWIVLVKIRDQDQNSCERFLVSNNAKAMKICNFTSGVVLKVQYISNKTSSSRI